jgi:hypothetical protein
MERILLTIALLVLGTVMAGAQDLNGIDVGTPMPKSTVKSLFGQWQRINELGEEDNYITYMYNNHDELVTYDADNKLGRFSICRGKKFKIFTKVVPGGIGIGDKISKLTKKIRFSESDDNLWIEHIEKGYDIYYYNLQSDCPLRISVRDSVVVSFRYDELPI